MSRRVLAVSWEMPPLSGPRAVQVSRMLAHLVPLGWESSVVCFGPRSTRYNQDPELEARLRAPHGVTLVPVPSLEERLFFRALWRIAPPVKLLPDEKWVWIHRATRVARRLAAESRFDALVSFAQPWSDHLIGLRLKRALGLPWVAHFSDPWSDSPLVRLHDWQRRLWRRMEAAVVREADAVVFVNEQTAARTMEKYPSGWRRKVHVVPHGFDPCETGAPLSEPSADRRLHIVYTGRFYEGFRTPEPVLRAVASLAPGRRLDGDLRVTFVGTPIPEHVRLSASLGLTQIVEFAGRRSFAESREAARRADVLLIIDAPSDENLFLPSKLVDYLPLNKPILGVTPVHGASADLIRRLGYPVVAPDDGPGIAGAIDALITVKKNGCLGLSPQHASVADAYDIRNTAAAFAAVLDRCA